MAPLTQNRVFLLFSACVVAVVMCIPWPDAQGPSLAKSIWMTFRDLNRTTALTIGRFNAFQADLTTPRSGEYVLPVVVREGLTILRGRRGSVVKRYDLSPSLTTDPWDFQQMIVAAWPRRLESEATARLVLNTDQMEPGCTLIDRQAHVSLVYCP